MRLNTLGHLELHDGDVPYLARRRKELVLLAILTRHAPLAVSRERLVELLWEGRDPARARHSLRQALTDLRRVLGEALVVSAEEVTLVPGAVELDAATFVTACVRHDWDTAISLWRGTFLDGADDVGDAALAEWLQKTRDELETLFFDACERRCLKAEAEGRWTDALANAELWLSHAPGSEPARARLTAVLRSLGRRSEADRLNDIERDVTTSLREPDFAGRTDAFDLLARAWDIARTGDRQVVVVRGTGGSGRSRLMREFARLVSERWPRCAVRRMSETPFPDGPTLVLADVAAQPETAAAVVEWLAQPAQRCLLVVTLPPGRGGMPGIEAAIRATPGAAHLELGPLSLDETHQVVRSMVPLPDRLLDSLSRRLHADTGGHPATLVRALSLLVAEGMLTCDPASGWRTTPGLGVAPLALDDPGERTRRRLDRMHADSRRVVDAAAVLGDAATRELIAGVTGLDEAVLDRGIEEALRRRLLRPAAGRHYHFYTETVRDAVYGQIPDARARALHRAAARALRRAVRADARLRPELQRHRQVAGLSFARPWTLRLADVLGISIGR